jgi:heme exporter protein D
MTTLYALTFTVPTVWLVLGLCLVVIAAYVPFAMWAHRRVMRAFRDWFLRRHPELKGRI